MKITQEFDIIIIYPISHRYLLIITRYAEIPFASLFFFFFKSAILISFDPEFQYLVRIVRIIPRIISIRIKFE